MRCLIIEDNQINAKICAKNLERLNVNFDFASNGKIGIEKLDGSQTYDFVILDIQMPVMDGYAVLNWVRSHDNDEIAKIPIVIYTAVAMDNIKSELLEHGADSFIFKPVARESFQKTILDVIEKLNAKK